MILIDRHGDRRGLAALCPRCGSSNIGVVRHSYYEEVECYGECGWGGSLTDLVAYVDEFPVEREP